MTLETFISESLTQIARGIEQAAVNLKDSTAIPNPRNMRPMVNNEAYYGSLIEGDADKPRYARVVDTIEFDVAVTITDGTATKGGIGIFAGAIGVGSQGASNNSNATVSRLKFRVPFVLPNPNPK